MSDTNDVKKPITDQPRMTYTDGPPSYKKRPLSPHLFVAHEYAGVADVHVQTGYPVWNLIAQWIVGNYHDDEVLAAYSDMPREEWEAAKQYYLDHKAIFLAQIIRTTQPYADEDAPPMNTLDDYLAWYTHLDDPREHDAPRGEDVAKGAQTHG